MAWGVVAAQLALALVNGSLAFFLTRRARIGEAGRLATWLFAVNAAEFLAACAASLVGAAPEDITNVIALFDLVTYPLILGFAFAFAAGGRATPRWQRSIVAGAWALALIVAGGLAVLTLTSAPTTSPLWRALITSDLFLNAFSFAVAPVVLAAAHRRAPDAATRRQLALVAAGFLVVSTGILTNYALELSGALHVAPPGIADATVVVFALFVLPATLAALASITTLAWRHGERGSAFVVASASLLGLAWVARLWVDADTSILLTFSGYGLVRPLLFTYAMLKYDMLDVDLRVKWTLRRGTVAAAFVAVFFAGTVIAENWLTSQFDLAVGGALAGLLLFAMRPIERVADRLADRAMPTVRADADYFAFRKMEIYKVTLTRAVSDGRLTPKEEAMLADLRRELGIGDEVHGRMVADLRAVSA